MQRDSQYIEVKLPKCVLMLTPNEIKQLVMKYDKELFATALKRGKYIKRHRQQKEREKKKIMEQQKMSPLEQKLKTDDVPISTMMKDLRIKHNLTKTYMAELLNITMKTYLKWESGKSIPNNELNCRYKLYNLFQPQPEDDINFEKNRFTTTEEKISPELIDYQRFMRQSLNMDTERFAHLMGESEINIISIESGLITPTKKKLYTNKIKKVVQQEHQKGE